MSLDKAHGSIYTLGPFIPTVFILDNHLKKKVFKIYIYIYIYIPSILERVYFMIKILFLNTMMNYVPYKVHKKCENIILVLTY